MFVRLAKLARRAGDRRRPPAVASSNVRSAWARTGLWRPKKRSNPVAAVRELTGGRGADIVIEAVGKPETWNWSVEMLRRGGTVNFFGGPPSGTRVELDTNLLHYSEITCKASFHHTPATMREALDIIASGGIPARDFVEAEEPLENLSSVLVPSGRGQRHAQDGDHSMTAARYALLPRDFVGSAEALSRVVDACRSRNSIRAGSPRTTTKTSTWSASCCRSICIRISTTSIPIAAGRTIWPTRSATPQESLRLLEWWSRRTGPHVCGRSAASRCSWRCVARCRSTAFPKQPFADLIRAFIQDQTVTRYQNWEGVLDYCVYSANPVGRLVLYLCGYSDAERQRLSDATCTALQLANFWQDVTVDQQKDRVYLPLDLLARHNYTVEELFAHKFDERFRAIMREAVDRARGLFLTGLPLTAHGQPAPGGGSGTFQPGRHVHSRQDRAAGLRRAVAPAVDFESGARAPAGRDAGARAPFARAAGMISLEESYAHCRAVAKSAREEFLLFVRSASAGKEECHVRDLCVHALLRRSERRARRYTHRDGSLA